ncbi:hypothetical protein EXE63_15390 [Mycolicibacterium frederiksbergense]|uniref:Uncharacterized protein n=1 Tax=Mycolicibacterium frederiksbergense TaxID=117567 RepID=A0A6H0S627_9MYCO|nr:hypothetical protein EXE63_15390 [Mycolicibacterium frederiksbergense]
MPGIPPSIAGEGMEIVGGGGNAYGPPPHTGSAGWLMQESSSGPVGGPGGSSGTGAPKVPAVAGTANACAGAPVTARKMSTPPATLFGTVPRNPLVVHLIARSSVGPHANPSAKYIDAERYSFRLDHRWDGLIAG